MAGNIWGLSLKGELGQTLSKIEFPDIATIVSTGAQKVIDNIPSTPVAVQDNSGNISTGYAANSDLAEFQVTEVQIPANFAGLEAVMVPTRLMDQLFEITEVDEQDDYVEVVAVHIFYQQRQNTTLWEPIAGNEYTAAAACRNVLDYAMFPVDFAVASDCTDKLPGSELDFARKNIVDAFLNPETGLCKKYDLSLIRDNDRFYCLKNVGFDRGFVIEDKKNLLGVQRNENIEDIVTRIAPVGYDDDGGIVWLSYNGKKYVDSPHVTDYARPKLGIYDTGLQIGRDGVTAENIQSKLLAEAQKQFTEKQVDLPAVTMTVQFVSLGDTEEYQQYRGLDKVYLFDIIHIKDEERGYQYAAQVIGVEHDVLRGMLNSVTIGTPEKWDGVRKVATWQIPEISGDNIRLSSIRAGSFQTNAIHSADIKSGAVEARHFSQSADNHFETIFAEQLIVSNTSEDGLLHTRFAVTEGLIQAEVTRATGAESSLSGQLTVEAGKISMVVGTRTTQSGEENYIKAGEITLAINNAGESEAHIDANKVYIGNDKSVTVINNKLEASDIDADFLNARIATIPTLTGIAANFSGNVTAAGGLFTQVYVGSGSTFTNISDGIAAVQITGPTNNVYKLQYKKFSQSSWQDAGSFNKAVSLSGEWNGMTYSVSATAGTISGTPPSTTIVHQIESTPNVSNTVYSKIYKGSPSNTNLLDSKTLTMTEKAADKYVELTENSTQKGKVSTQDTWNNGYSNAEPTSGTLGAKVTGTNYTINVKKTDTTLKAITVNLAGAYNDGWNDCIAAMGLNSASGGGYYFYRNAYQSDLLGPPMTPTGQCQRYWLAEDYGTISGK